MHNACQWETFSTQCSWETHFPDLRHHYNVQNEVPGLDVCGRGMGTGPCDQMSIHVCWTHLYTRMWKPENNVLLPSSLILDFTLRFVFWDKLSHRTCSYSIQLHCLWGPVQYGGYVQPSLLYLAFTWWSGWEPRSSSLYCRCNTNWATSLDIV